MSSPRLDDSRRPIADILVPPVLLLGPLFHFLRYHGYPLLRAEILIIVGGTILAGVAVGWILHRASPEFRLALLNVLILVVVDLLVAVHLTRYEFYLLVLAVAGVLVWLLRRNVTSILLASGLAFLVGTLLVPTPNVYETAYSSRHDVEADRSLPPIFHFVFDEHIGVDGLPSEQLRDELVSAYLERGFRIFPNSYSHYSRTINSLPNLLNYTTESVDSVFIESSGFGATGLRQNRHFAAAASRGYRIRVYQPAFLNFCHPEGVSVASCFTYPGNTVGDIADQPMPVLAKAQLVAVYFLANQLFLYRSSGWLYRSVHRLLGSVNVSLPAWDWVGDHVTPPISVLTDRLLAETDGDPRGEFVFAHVLMLHYPFMYDAHCVPKPHARDRLDAWSPNAPPRRVNTEESRRRRYELYEEQVQCVLREFEHLLATLEALPGFEDAVIIVHGDHGPKITITPPLLEHFDSLTSRDLRDSYSTLFAVRAPGVPAGRRVRLRVAGAVDGIAALRIRSGRTARGHATKTLWTDLPKLGCGWSIGSGGLEERAKGEAVEDGCSSVT